MPEKNKKNINSKTFYAISLAWQLGFLIIVPILSFFLLGYWVDRGLRTMPLFLILGTIIGIVTSIFGIYHLLTPLIKNKKKHD